MTAQPLTTLAVGQQAEILAITSTQAGRLAHLSAYGVVPGSFIRLYQRHFAYVILINETEIALDGDVASEIMVRVE